MSTSDRSAEPPGEAHRSREQYLAAVESAARLLLASSVEAPYQEYVDIIGPVSGASRMQLFLHRIDDRGRELTHLVAEWCDTGIEPFLEDPRLQGFDYRAAAPTRAAAFDRGEPVNNHVADLPEEERPLLDEMGILSVLGLPLVVDSDWVGFIAFNTCLREHVWSDGEIHLLGTVAADLAQAIRRHRAESALRRSEERYRQIVETSLEGVWIVDTEARITFANRRMAEMLMRPGEEILGHVLHEFMSPDSARISEAFVEGGLEAMPDLHDIVLVRRDGSELLALCSCKPIRDGKGNVTGALGMMTDITDRKRGDEAMIQASRMEATATLAGGIAHDFNNLMVGVLGNAELLREFVARDPDALDMLNSIVGSARRAGELSQQMLAYARGGKYLPKPLNLNDTIQEAIRFQARSFPPRVRLERDIEPDLWTVRADPNQMSQVIMNLCINAAESIEGHGTITVRTRNVKITGEESADPEPIPPGRYALIRVTDTGCGMSEEIRRRIFEPFYSTKFQGRGLGLAAAYGIVRNHSGHLRVESAPEQGSTFEIFIPTSTGTPESPAEPGTDDRSGRETILFVDDEAVVVDVSRKILERFGYRVLTALDGEEAVEIVKRYEATIDLAVLDMGMPTMGGAEAFPLLKTVRPGMKVILCSGYELDSAAQALLDAGAVAFVQKPFQAVELAKEIRKALDAD